MHADRLLRAHALEDLVRLIPVAHYAMREHSPEADLELTRPLLKEPSRFSLTLREHIAAEALFNQAFCEVRFRAIFDATYPVRDASDETPPAPMTAQDENEINARRANARKSAYVYAKFINSPLLIDAFQPLPDTFEPAPAPAPAAIWRLKMPVRDDGLAGPIYRVLKQALEGRSPRPSAREVLDNFRQSQTPGIVRVLADRCDYLDARGEEKSADLESIRKRITGMTDVANNR